MQFAVDLCRIFCREKYHLQFDCILATIHISQSHKGAKVHDIKWPSNAIFIEKKMGGTVGNVRELAKDSFIQSTRNDILEVEG